MTTPRILDGTIRDGSDVVDFQFSAEDTVVIAAGLESSEPFVRQALGLGLHVSVNLMRSYAVPPDQLVDLSKMAEGSGAEVSRVQRAIWRRQLGTEAG